VAVSPAREIPSNGSQADSLPGTDFLQNLGNRLNHGNALVTLPNSQKEVLGISWGKWG
jgi:hypothetical protein